MLDSVGIFADMERLARSMFSPEQVPDVLAIVGWYDDVQVEDVRRAMLTLGKGSLRPERSTACPTSRMQRPQQKHDARRPEKPPRHKSPVS